MRRIILILALWFLALGLLRSNVSAQSSYVLPYPSEMPGSTFYRLSLVKEWIERYWYFGNFGQYAYNMKMSDKYLVQSKTLFEYEQYLLAYKALERSNRYFSKINQFLDFAEKEGKDISEKGRVLTLASRKHIEVLEKLKKENPQETLWAPENDKKVLLFLHKILDYSISLRKQVL